jgi:hypothetical protein
MEENINLKLAFDVFIFAHAQHALKEQNNEYQTQT